MADLGKSFECLPIEQLICAPIVAVAEGQAELCRVYLDNLFRLAFKKGNSGDSGGSKSINSIDFNLERMIVDDKGDTKKQNLTVSAPLLSLVPVPAFTMDEATVRFTMEIKEVNTQKSEKTSEGKADIGFGKWGFSAKISGKVTSSSSNTRTSDHSAKYDIFARAVQQPPAEGMAKLTSIFASVIEPIEVGGSQA
ncbi:MAG: DUF2589 domain-containing protein [Oscillospiraceae bacterium]|nr:DUF2589 domain-containing protein [Oscillospiraceae bacterium]